MARDIPVYPFKWIAKDNLHRNYLKNRRKHALTLIIRRGHPIVIVLKDKRGSSIIQNSYDWGCSFR